MRSHGPRIACGAWSGSLWLLLAGCLREPLTGLEGAATDHAGEASSTTGSDTNSDAGSEEGAASAVMPTSSGAATTTAPTTGTGAATSGGEAPTGCGDGVVANDELCDDGNDLPDDGCDPDCQPAGQLLWTRTHAGPAHSDDGWGGVAIGPDGRVVAVGSEGVDVGSARILLSVYTSTGDLIWERVLDGAESSLSGLYAVTVGPDGTIFAAGHRGVSGYGAFGVLLAFTSEGELLWEFAQEVVLDRSSWIDAIDLTDGVLVSAGSDRDDLADGLGGEDQFILVRRHDPGTGAELWKQTPATAQPRAKPGGITIAGGQVIVAGGSWTSLDEGRFLAAYDLSGALEWSHEDPPDSLTGWSGVRAIGGGDVVLAGYAPGEGNAFRLVVQRLGPAGEERWTYVSPGRTVVHGCRICSGKHA